MSDRHIPYCLAACIVRWTCTDIQPGSCLRFYSSLLPVAAVGAAGPRLGSTCCRGTPIAELVLGQKARNSFRTLIDSLWPGSRPAGLAPGRNNTKSK